MHEEIPKPSVRDILAEPVAIHQDELLHPLRRAQCEGERSSPSNRNANKGGTLDAQRVQQALEEACVVGKVVPEVWCVAPSVARPVEGEHGTKARQRLDSVPVGKLGGIEAAAVEKQRRRRPSRPGGEAAYAQPVHPYPDRLHGRANLANHRDPIVPAGPAAKPGISVQWTGKSHRITREANHQGATGGRYRLLALLPQLAPAGGLEQVRPGSGCDFARPP